MDIMDAKQYFSELNTASQSVFVKTTDDIAFLGNLHDCSISLQEWVNVLGKEPFVNLIKHSRLTTHCLTMRYLF